MAEEETGKFHERVIAVVRRVPRGRVASYKLVGTVAGYPRAARFVGRVMRLARGAPWWRIVAQDGRIVIMDPALRREQVMRLEAEGIPVSAEGRVDYERFAWRPRSSSPSAGKTPRRG